MSILAPTKAYQQGLDCPLFAPLRDEQRSVRPDTATGEQNAPNAKEKGFQGAQLAAEAAGDEWTEAAYREACRILFERGWMVAEHVWQALRAKGIDTDHPKAMGAVLARIRREGKGENTHMQMPTEVERSHGRPQTIWARPGFNVSRIAKRAGLQ